MSEYGIQGSSDQLWPAFLDEPPPSPPGTGSRPRQCAGRRASGQLIGRAGGIAGAVSADDAPPLNSLIKKIKRIGHGFRSFRTYRLRVPLYAGDVKWDTPSTVKVRTRRARLVAQSRYSTTTVPSICGWTSQWKYRVPASRGGIS